MKLSREIAVDLRHALNAIEGDTSAVWKLTAADSLEAIARRVREEVAATPTTPDAPARHCLEDRSKLRD